MNKCFHGISWGLLLFLIFLGHRTLFACPTEGLTANNYYSDKESHLEIQKLQVEKLRIFLNLFSAALSPDQREKISDIKLDYQPYLEPNACAGSKKITVFDGLTLFVENDDQLAFVLAHELGHVLENHYVKSIAKAAVATVAANAAAISISSVAGGGAAGNLAGGVTGEIIGGGMVGAFSRPQERAADKWAVTLLYESGFDVENASQLMLRWLEYMPKTNAPNFFSTHPVSKERFNASLEMFHELESVNGNAERKRSVDPQLQVIQNKLLSYGSTINRQAFLENIKARFENYGLGKINPDLTAQQVDMGLETIGFCLDNLNGQGPKNRTKSVFVSQKKIFWYADYKYSTLRDLKHAFKKPRLKAEWFSPDGSLFSEDIFTFSDQVSQFAFSKLEWDVELGSYLVGRWKVRVTGEGELIDEREFEVLK